MTPVPTHKGGPFYEWYVSVYGYGPPATVDSDAARYLAWQQGIPKALAALIPYGAMGDPGIWIAGGALTVPPAPPPPAPTPAPAPPPPAPAPPPPAPAPPPTPVPAPVTVAPAPAPAATYVVTHKGGDFYEWYLSVYGVAPPAQVNSQAARYLAWKQGIAKSLAVLIPYGAIGDPSLFITGGALLAPTQVTTPQTGSTPVTAPAATLTEAGVTPTPVQPAPADLPPSAGGPVPPATGKASGGLPAGATLATISDYSDPASVAQQKAMYNAWRTNSNRNNVVLSALFLIGTAENGWDPNTCNGYSGCGCARGCCGVFQVDCSKQAEHDYRDTQYWAGEAIHSGFYGDYGGLEQIVADHPGWSIGDIVQACQGAGPSWADAAHYYNGRAAEANAVLVAFEQHYVNATAPPPTTPTTGVGGGEETGGQTGTNKTAGWGTTHQSGAVNQGYYQLQKTYSVWNPQFRQSLRNAATRPLEG